MRAARYLLLVTVGAALAGCGSSPPVRFYALDAMPGAEAGRPTDVMLGIGPISFPDYLRRPQIVTRGAGTRLELAEFDRWAEPLEMAFSRTLTANLDALLADVLVIEFPFGGGRVQPEYRLMAQVNRFDVDATGSAVLDVRWGVLAGDGGELLAPRRAEYRASAGASGDYDRVVQALGELLQAFSRDVAGAYRTVNG